MKLLQVDEKAVSVNEPENRSGWSLRVTSTAGDRRLKEVRTTLPDPQTKGIHLCSMPHLGERE
jgi:3'-phosphoadenosine 5'-phosphosulfate sulfotransferase